LSWKLFAEKSNPLYGENSLRASAVAKTHIVAANRLKIIIPLIENYSGGADR